jgi:hypothetical protein
MNKIRKKSMFIKCLYFETEIACKISEVSEKNEEKTVSTPAWG